MVRQLELDGIKLICPKIHRDERGFFSEAYSAPTLRPFGISTSFVQDNHSYSRAAGTVRGLHFQVPPFAQDKLVRVVRGKIIDVAVDLRRSSKTYGKHVAVELSAENWLQLLIPVGFAHAVFTLEPHTEVLYKVSAPYSKAHDAGLYWADPDLAIRWPIARTEDAVVSEKDHLLPKLRDFSSPF